MIEIVPCIVGNRDRDSEILDTFRSLGLPLSTSTCEQVDCTRNTVQDFAKADPDKLRRVHTRTMSQVAEATSRSPDYVYVDHEYADQSGLRAVPDDSNISLTASYISYTAGSTGASVSLWNCVGVYNGLPVTTQSSIDTFHKVDKVEPLGWIHINTYIRKHIDTDLEAVSYCNRLASAVSIGRELAGEREVLPSYQARLRVKGSESETEPLTIRDVFAYWQTMAACGVKKVLWYIPTGPDGQLTDTFLQDLTDQAPVLLDAIESTKPK